MDADSKRLAFALVLMMGVGVVSSAFGSVNERGYDRWSVEGLLDDRPFGSKVRVVADVVDVMERYESSSGEVFQRFVVGSDDSRLLVFCSTVNGAVNVSVGDMVDVRGRFTSYKGTLEVSTECFRVERKG